MIKKRKVGISAGLPKLVIDELKAQFEVFSLECSATSAIHLDAVVTTWQRGFSETDIRDHPSISYLSVYGTGTERIDVDLLRELNIGLGTTCLDGTDHAVAECALALCLSLSRFVLVGDRFVRSGSWPKSEFPITTGMRGSNVGIIGLGYIGKQVAERCAALGASVSYFGRSAKLNCRFRFFDDILELARFADTIFLTCRGGTEMDGIVNHAVLGRLGPKGYLINVAQPRFVNELELLEALEAEAIGGAAMDVFANEPHINPRFFTARNVVLYPHAASKTAEVLAARRFWAVRNILDHFQLC